jgi:hypothetical protein
MTNSPEMHKKTIKQTCRDNLSQLRDKMRQVVAKNTCISTGTSISLHIV